MDARIDRKPAGSRLRVLFITRKWAPAVGGMETYCRELVGELRPRLELQLTALPGRANGRPPSLSRLLAFGLRTALALLVRPPAVDVVHGADLAIWPLVWLAARRAQARPILSAHGTDIALAHRRGLTAMAYRAYLKFGAALLPSLTVVANSGATARLCTALGFRSAQVVPLASRVAPALPAPSPEPFVLFAGRLIPAKGCGWFIREVLPHLPDGLRLVVAGTVLDPAERAALAHPRIDYRGPLGEPELSRLRCVATAIVMPNLDPGGVMGFEGFGLAATEGAAAGGVVLAARLHGIIEAVEDGVTGILLPPGDAAAWATAIATVVGWTSARRQAFIDAALKRIADRYSWSRVADDTVAAYGAPKPTSASRSVLERA